MVADDMRYMTNQDIFDRVWAVCIVQQGGRRSYEGASCRYRSSDGRRCAVGALIPDDRYTAEIEGSTVASAQREEDPGDSELLTILRAVVGTDVTTHALLAALQGDHDGASPMLDMAARFRITARAFGLVSP